MSFTFDPKTGRYVDLAAPTPLAPSNPFLLYTKPGPGRVAIGMEDAISHLQDLDAIHSANDDRIAELEQRLARGRSNIDRGGFVGKTDREIEAIARAVGRDPNQEGWAQSANLRPGTPEWQRFVVEGNTGGMGSKRFTGETSNTTQLRGELKALRATNSQIVSASEALLEQATGDTVFYRFEQVLDDLPFGEIANVQTTNALAASTGNRLANKGAAARSRQAGLAAHSPCIQHRDRRRGVSH